MINIPVKLIDAEGKKVEFNLTSRLSTFSKKGRIFFNNKEFTEAIPHGKKPLSQHIDLIYIGTGTFNNVTYEQNNNN